MSTEAKKDLKDGAKEIALFTPLYLLILLVLAA